MLLIFSYDKSPKKGKSIKKQTESLILSISASIIVNPLAFFHEVRTKLPTTH